MQKNKINIVSVIIGAVFIIAALMIALVSFFTVQYVVKTMQLVKLPGVVINDEPAADPNAAQNGELPAAVPAPASVAPDVNAPAPWDGASRVNILFLGLDARDWLTGEGPPRSDTMILASIDPLTKSAAMISIPRDLWVSIPGFTYGRINTAYQLGEGSKLPGGGPALAAKTVENILGVPINYYGQVDFQAFVDFIDAIGGIKVKVEEPIKIDMLGNEQIIVKKNGVNVEMGDKTVKNLKPGVWNMDGRMALAYARERKGTKGGDFDRSLRQQQVILSIRDRMLQFDQYGMFLTDIPAIYQKLSSGIHTNMSFDDAFRLAYSVMDMPLEKIQKGVIDTNYITFASSPDGTQQVLKLRPEEIRRLRDQVFATGQTTSQIAQAGLEYAVQAEHARLGVMNGVAGSGNAVGAADYLKSLGLNVISTGDAPQASSVSMLIDYTGNPYTLRYLKQLLGVGDRAIRSEYTPDSQIDVALVVGNDYRQP